jgi:protein-S-isoprenylcysteine O-methyltransferase Ste14
LAESNFTKINAIAANHWSKPPIWQPIIQNTFGILFNLEAAMRHFSDSLIRIALFLFTLLVWIWVFNQDFQSWLNLTLIAGGMLLIFPVVWLGRRLLDLNPTMSRTIWITTFVHYPVLILLGVAIIRAVITHQDWAAWLLPIPVEIGLLLAIPTGAAALLSVLNLALKGLGAPFAIALSQRLAVDWLYAWTRNPMVLGTLAFLVALGIWFQSTLFVLWVVLLVTPALLFFVKVYEERELEIRFGAPYLAYKARTPMLFPRKPRQ